MSGKDNLVRGVSNVVGARTGETRVADEGTRVRKSGGRDDGGATEEIQASGAHGSRKR